VAKNDSTAEKRSDKAKRATRKGSRTPPEVQAQIIGVLLTGQFRTDEEAANAIGVSKSTVSRLRASIPDEYLKLSETLKKERIADRVVDFIDEALDSLIRVNRITLDQDWLLSQDAASLATFYGVSADKVIRILEASENAHRRNEGSFDGN
jgi:hypothetical protein